MDFKFKPFWFESNLYFGTIQDMEGFKHLVANYARNSSMSPKELLKKSKESETRNKSERNFGLRREHQGETTLYAYLVGEGVDVEALIAELDNFYEVYC